MAESAPIILVVEDNLGDVELIREALVMDNNHTEIYVVHDGDEALDFLHKRGAFMHAPTPQLVMMDINMPRMDGHEALKAVKEDDGLRSIPVVILSSSVNNRDIAESYYRYANGHVVKPVSTDDFIDAVKSVKQFWTNVAESARH